MTLYPNTMITNASEWVYRYASVVEKVVRRDGTTVGGDKMKEINCQRWHILFPPINPGQYIPGSADYIPLYHDGIAMDEREELETLFESLP